MMIIKSIEDLRSLFFACISAHMLKQDRIQAKKWERFVEVLDYSEGGIKYPDLLHFEVCSTKDLLDLLYVCQYSFGETHQQRYWKAMVWSLEINISCGLKFPEKLN